MFGKLLFFFVFPKLGISYKVKKEAILVRGFLRFACFTGKTT